MYGFFMYVLKFRVCKPAYSGPVPKAGNREGFSRRGISVKISRCMAWLTLTRICVAAAGLLVVIQ